MLTYKKKNLTASWNTAYINRKYYDLCNNICSKHILKITKY